MSERICHIESKYPPCRCKHKDCIYHASKYMSVSGNGCNYILITGRSRIAQLPKDKRDPALCPLYEKGKRKIPSRKAAITKSDYAEIYTVGWK